MQEKLEKLGVQASEEIQRADSIEKVEEIRRSYLGKKGHLTSILRSLTELPQEDRKKIGGMANRLRDSLQEEVSKKKEALESSLNESDEVDVTAPGNAVRKGSLHPLTLVQRRMVEIFREMGFGVAEGPDIESEWYNFDALNIPAHHPARDMWDTFWVKPREEESLLRTHTSPVQVRFMEQNEPPFRIIAPGKVFRYEATDARHGFELYQLEGLVIGKDISAANFRAILQEFYRRFFGEDVNIRLRPSYFPFVEPGFEVDMSCVFCSSKKGSECSSCGGSGWMEMMGAGMVHPNVFKAAGYDPNDWQGFAFGMGVDRLTMMKYKINDIRILYSGDVHMLRQF